MDGNRAEKSIITSWHTNAAPWTDAVRGRQIESRRVSTDEAVISAIAGRAPRTVIDVGCGEGWLGRALAARGIRVLGVDVSPALIERARGAGGGDFQVMDYGAIAEGKLAATADVLVCNFSLFGDKSVDQLFAAAPALLNPGGAFIVQTLHPVVACGGCSYEDGWRDGSWKGFGPEFTDPAPWYFRTLGSWLALFVKHGFRVSDLREPLHPQSGKPASVLFVAEVCA